MLSNWKVYNENIRDLLNDTGEFLDLREDPIKVQHGLCAIAETLGPVIREDKRIPT